MYLDLLAACETPARRTTSNVAPRPAFSLLELLAVLSVAALVVTILLPTAAQDSVASRTAACYVIQGNIEIQAELWHHQTGSWPATDLSNIGADVNYFPEGLPTCPVDGTAFTIDTNGRVVGHDH